MMVPALRRLARLPFMLAALMASPAFGQETSAEGVPEENEAELLEEAQALVNEASSHYAAGELEEALTKLRAAEGLATRARDPSLPSIRFNIARVLEQLERPREALEAYERYDALPDASHRKQKAFEAMQALRGRVFAVLSVSCAPAGAIVEIEGLMKGMQPCPWQGNRVPPGTYEVVVSAPGHVPATEEVQLAAGEARNVQVSLTPDVSYAPRVGAPKPEGGGFPVWPVVALGGGAAVAGAGAAFTGLALGARDDAQSLPPGEERDEAVQEFEDNRTLSYVLFGVGGALAAAGVALFFVPGGDDDPEAARFEPGPSGFTVRF